MKGGWRFCRIDTIRLESNYSSQQMTTRHTGCRFARHFENNPQVSVKGVWRFCVIDTIRVESNYSSRHMTTRHTGCMICKTLRKYSASICEGALKMLLNRHDAIESNDSSPLMTTRHTRCRFARHLENIPQVSVHLSSFIIIDRHLLWRVVRFGSNHVESSTFATLYSL